MSVQEFVTSPALVCLPTTGVVDAARLMAEALVGFLVVVNEEGRPVGVLTDRDIVVRWVARRPDQGVAVSALMTRHPACVSVGAAVTEAARIMADRQCRRLVVTDDAARVAGVLSLDDLLGAAGDEFVQLARAVRGGRAAHTVLP
jgi:signal-transduction protein with cAMP-binding, CBS, and nucleotidyltransferase domain